MSRGEVLPLGEVVKPTRPRVKPSDFPDLPFIGMEHVEAHSMKLLGTVPAATMKSSAVHFKPGDVLYGRLRPYLNKVYRPTFEGLCSAEFIVLPANERVDGAYLQYFINSSAFVRYASHLNTGDRPRVDFDQLAPYEIPLPAVEEQRRIVAELEKQLSRLDEAVANLRRAKANLKRYKSAVLKAAVEGRLVSNEAELAEREGRVYETGTELLQRVRQSRESLWTGSRKYKQPRESDDASLPTLPRGWAWATWDQIGFSQNGRAFPSSEYCDFGVRLLRPGNLHESGAVVWTEGNTKHMPARYLNENPDLVVRGGELVMNLTAQSLKDEFLGRICVTDSGEQCLLNQRLARLTPIEVLPRFAFIVFKSMWFRKFVDGLNTGSLIQHMFTSQLAEFPFPLPPLAEQRRIAAEVDLRLERLFRLENELASVDLRAQALRSATLAHSFSLQSLEVKP